MHHQAYFSPYFQTKRLAIGYKEVPRREPQLRDASCGTAQGFFLTQDTSPMAIDYPSEQHWMPTFKPANPSVGNSNHDNYQNKASDSKHDSPKDEDEPKKVKKFVFSKQIKIKVLKDMLTFLMVLNLVHLFSIRRMVLPIAILKGKMQVMPK